MIFNRRNVVILDLSEEERAELTRTYHEALSVKVRELLEEYDLDGVNLEWATEKIVNFLLYSEQSERQKAGKRDAKKDIKVREDLARAVDRVVKHLRSDSHNWVRDAERAISKLVRVLQTLDGHFCERLEAAACIDTRLDYESGESFSVYDEIGILDGMPVGHLKDIRQWLLNRMVALKDAINDMEELKDEEWSLHNKLIEALVIDVLAPNFLEDKRRHISGVSLVQRLCLYGRVLQKVLEWYTSHKDDAVAAIDDDLKNDWPKILREFRDLYRKANNGKRMPKWLEDEIESFYDGFKKKISAPDIGWPTKRDPYAVDTRIPPEKRMRLVLDQARETGQEFSIAERRPESEEPEGSTGRVAPMDPWSGDGDESEPDLPEGTHKVETLGRRGY